MTKKKKNENKNVIDGRHRLGEKKEGGEKTESRGVGVWVRLGMSRKHTHQVI